MYELASDWTVYGQESSIIVVGNWSHYAFTRTAGIHKLYRDGILQSAVTGAAAHNPSDNVLRFGLHRSDAGRYYTGYMDELGFYSVNKYTSVALPGQATITPNHLSDPSGNHFTASGLAVTDQMVDTPENNFCTLNPLAGAATYAEGNLKVTSTVAGSAPYNQVATTTIHPSVGKWYWEATQLSTGGVELWGFTQNDANNKSRHNHYGSAGNFGWLDNGNVHTGGGSTLTTIWDTFTTGDIVAFALDLDNQKVIAYKNGVAQPEIDFSNSLILGMPTSPTFVNDHTGANWSAHFNFGQGDPDGENNYTDSNGVGGFRFPPPDGYLAICTKNMKDVDYAPIGPNTAAGAPDQHLCGSF